MLLPSKHVKPKISYKHPFEKEQDDIWFRRRGEFTRGGKTVKSIGTADGGYPRCRSCWPGSWKRANDGKAWLRAVHGIVVIYQVEGGEEERKESRRRAALTSRVLILVYRAKRERNMVSNGVQPFLPDYLRSANFIPVKRARINEPWKRIVLQGDSERYDARCPDLKFGRCFLNVSTRNSSSGAILRIEIL